MRPLGERAADLRKRREWAAPPSDWAGYAEVPAFSEHRVEADWIAASKDDPSALHVASTGLSWVGQHGEQITVEYGQCAACLAWPDGRRTLLGRDGFTLSVEPTLVEHGSEVVKAIDAAVPPQLVVRMAPRSPDAVPQQAPPPERKGWRRRRG